MKRKQPKTRKDEKVPKDLVEHLVRHLPKLAAEKFKYQTAIAWMLWIGGLKRRRHQKYADHYWFDYADLNNKFGRRKFLTVNDRVGLFTVTAWSKEQHTTKGYKPTDAAQQALRNYLDQRFTRTTGLLTTDGRAEKTIPEAVASKSMDGLTISRWRNAKRLNRVKVDVAALARLQKKLRKERDMLRARVDVGGDHETQAIRADRIQRLIDTAAQILRLANTETAGKDFVAHRYVMARSGRLYARDVNLQTVPIPIKQAALAGLWEYDIANCHYAILLWMAKKIGHSCPTIAVYLAAKETTRSTIADEVGISVAEAKYVLIAALYGATKSPRPGSAIADKIGEEKAKVLFANRHYVAIDRDIATARRKILAKEPRSSNGWIKNAFGQSIRVTSNSRKILAHLIQGVEATCLQAAIDLYPKDIVLVQHDGFAASRQLEVDAIEAAMLRATGCALKLEEKQIKVDHKSWLDRR
jgi:hypothetical protein